MIAVQSVDPGSLAERAGFRGGDRILSVNGAAVADAIDFQVASAEDDLVFEVERGEEVYEVDVGRRPAGEALGFTFEEMRLRRCNNKCVFCFLHQMPPGLRRSLYFEDDDYRLSFLHGSYVTLTNLRQADLERIAAQRLTPQYISVHATDPETRQRLLGRRRPAVPILDRIAFLAQAGIEMHTQVVLCPGWNDGDHLDRTVADLKSFYPSVRSVALVPVGLTRFRAHLPSLQPVTPELARRYVEQAERWGEACARELGERFVYPGDELFLLSGRTPPEADYYGAFPQVENGVGMVRTFLDRWHARRSRLTGGPGRPLHLALVTGMLARTFLDPIAAELNRLPGLRVDLLAVANDYFGHGITVSGLLAAADVVARLRGGSWDLAVLPPNAVNGDGMTLDEMTVPQIADAAGLAVTVGEYDLVDTLRCCFDGEAARDRGLGRQLSELGFHMVRGGS